MTEQDLDQWLESTESCDDNIDAGHIAKMAATLGRSPLEAGDALPMLWHWGLFQQPEPYDQLGADGHPETGGFLPPAGGGSRMWAGGQVEFIHPLLVGTPATRKSSIQSIEQKEGRSGRLLVVTVEHEYVQDYVACIREEQQLVYREPAPLPQRDTDKVPESEWSCLIKPDPVMLFRYSAVTFNGHRIHYDHEYVTRHEGYPGLVVHGPLIATLMCREFTRAHRDKVPTLLRYRGLRPLIAPTPFSVGGRLLDPSAVEQDEEPDQESNKSTDGGVAHLWAEQDGTLAHEAHLHFKP